MIKITDCVGKSIIMRDNAPDICSRRLLPDEYKDARFHSVSIVSRLSDNKKYVLILFMNDLVRETSRNIGMDKDRILSEVESLLRDKGILASAGSTRETWRPLWLSVDSFCDDEHKDRRFEIVGFDVEQIQ